MMRAYLVALVLFLLGAEASKNGISLWLILPLGLVLFVVILIVLVLADATMKNTWGFGGPRKDKFG